MRSETRHIGSGIPLEQVRSYTFGDVVRRSTGVIQRYHSDLYHVATALQAIIPDDTIRRQFMFVVVIEPDGCAIERFHGGPIEASYLRHEAAIIHRYTIEGNNLNLFKCKWMLMVQSTDADVPAA